MAQGDALLEAGLIKRAGANTPGWFSNIGLAEATTTNADDSIKITSADGTALSKDNVGHVTLPSTTSGLLSTFTITADVTIDLTGAHFGEGTKGDLTDYMLSVYAINDSGTLKWGVASIPNHWVILDADDTASAASVTSIEKVLVNSALAGDSSCLEIGWFKAAFNDTGDEWTVQTGIGDINLGRRPSIFQDWTPDGSWTGANTTYEGYWRREGGLFCSDIRVLANGAVTAANLTVNLPSGLVVDTGRATTKGANASALASTVSIRDSGTDNFEGLLRYNNTTSVAIFKDDGDGTVGAVSNTSPMTWASGDFAQIYIRDVPIVGWS